MFKDFSFNRVTERIKKSWEFIQKDMVNYGLMIFVGNLVQGVTGGILAGPISVGFFNGARKLQREGKTEIGQSFSAMSKFGAAFLMILVPGLLIGLVYGIVFGLNFGFAMLASAVADVAVVSVIVTILVVLLTIALWVVFAIAVLIIFQCIYMGFVLIAEENLGFGAAFKKGFAWMKEHKGMALELVLGNVLCSLFSIIPIVGPFAVIGFSTLYTLMLYDTEKEAGRLA